MGAIGSDIVTVPTRCGGSTMRKIVLATALVAFAGSPAMACEYMNNVSTPIPTEEDVVMTPAPTTSSATVTAEDS